MGGGPSRPELPSALREGKKKKKKKKKKTLVNAYETHETGRQRSSQPASQPASQSVRVLTALIPPKVGPSCQWFFWTCCGNLYGNLVPESRINREYRTHDSTPLDAGLSSTKFRWQNFKNTQPEMPVALETIWDQSISLEVEDPPPLRMTVMIQRGHYAGCRFPQTAGGPE